MKHLLSLSKHHTRPTLFFLKLMLVFYVVFFLCRLLFLQIYSHEFDDLTWLQTMYALLKGALFFDTSITLVFLGIPFLISYLPWRWCVSQRYLSFITWYSFVVLCVFVFLLAADLLYFGLVHRHAGHEVGATLNSSAMAMVGIAFSEYWLQLLVMVVVVFLGAKLWGKWMLPQQKKVVHQNLSWLSIPVFVSMFLLILLGMRGGVTSKPIQAIFAYDEGPMEQGHLALNGAFSILHGLKKSTMHTPQFMSKEDAIATSQLLFASSRDAYPDANYPLMRQRDGLQQADKPNVVILLLESWDSAFVDFARITEGKMPFGVTPNYDALVKEGRFYANFYANGQRSIDGISSVIAGIPTVPGAGYLGEGIEVNTMGWLPKLAKAQGYSTAFMQSSYRASFYLDKISALAGFDTYMGAEDLRPSAHQDAITPDWGGWDYDLFNKAQHWFEAQQQPFFGMLFTASTHTPWQLPDKRWEKFAPTGDQEKLLNTMYYTDWVLGEFFKKVKSSAFANNTIFLILGDHVSGLAKNPTTLEQHHIPLLMLGPGIQAGVDNTLAGQLDLIPTLMDLAG